MAETEKKEEKGKKKGSKLPIIVIMVAMLAAGGFFGMKMHPSGKAKKPEVKLAAGKPVELKQFLTNLRERDVYCRADISLGLADGADPKKFDEQDAPVRDAINTCLMNLSVADASTDQGREDLKKKIAAAVNKVFATEKDSEDKKVDESKADDSKSLDKSDPKIAHPDWESQSGPVLKVYFSSFATQ